MENILFLIALVTGVYLFLTIVEFTFGFKRIRNLSAQPTVASATLPRLSIIFSALDEEADIEKALHSFLTLNYPNLEVIAINDRSTDKTPEILDRFKQFHPNLQVLHINSLPENWLGKNHALYVGSQHATGDWLLFTDADVVMKKESLLKAMSYVFEKKLDHLTIWENHQHHNFWLNVLLFGHYITYSLVMKPWRIRYSKSKKFLGHGTFNLVNKKAYLASGGHQAIALECFDDLKLGKIIKENGFKQDTVDGRDFIEKQWYKSLIEMIHGMKKNNYAYYEYRFYRMIIDVLFAIIFFLWPLVAAICFSGVIQSLNLINVLLTLYVCIQVSTHFRMKKLYIVLYPISISILLFTVLNSALFTHLNKGIVWRGTHYPLKKLKNKKYTALGH